MTDPERLFATYHAETLRGFDVIEGVLHPHLDPDDPELRAGLAALGSHYFFRPGTDDTVVVVRYRRSDRPERWGLHVALLLATLATTTLAGAYLAGGEPLVFAPGGGASAWLPRGFRSDALLSGMAFSFPLVAILLAHELGHYVAALRRGMDVSPPYFLPMLPVVSPAGTLGAVIHLRSPILTRSALLVIGAAGPAASFVLSLIALAVGMAWSEAQLRPPWAETPYLVWYGAEGGFAIGGSALVLAAHRLLGPDSPAVLLHPLACAGWFGLFVTALNLLPVSQLDGGHIAYALLRRGQRWVGLVTAAALLWVGSPMGTGWWGWWVWVGLILIVGRGSVEHPPVVDPEAPLPTSLRWVGWLSLVALLLCFTPAPFPF